MRSKLILIRGNPGLVATTEGGLDIDTMVIALALLKPHHSPEGLHVNVQLGRPGSLDAETIHQICSYWEPGDEAGLARMYADHVVEVGAENIRVVEGAALKSDWVFRTVSSYHKMCGQRIQSINEVFLGEQRYFGIHSSLVTLEEAETYLSLASFG